jgi:hypothetical protein
LLEEKMIRQRRTPHLLRGWNWLGIGLIVAIASACGNPAPETITSPSVSPSVSRVVSPTTSGSPSVTRSPERSAPATNSAASPPERVVSSITNSAPPNSASTEKPETKTELILVEGESTEMQLKRFDQSGFPIATYFPSEHFTEEMGASGEGQSVRFDWTYEGQKDENVYLHLFFPSGSPTAAEVSDLVRGDRGILAQNNWQAGDQAPDVGYSWVKEAIAYQDTTSSDFAGGVIFIGEHEGKGFYAIAHYPAEYADGFEPRADVILSNLEFR